jgi:hypothetical protein
LNPVLKELLRKAVFRSGGGPPKFCYRSLLEDLMSLCLIRPPGTTPGQPPGTDPLDLAS